MADINYEKMVEAISRSSKLSKEEVEAKVSAKIDKLSGLISREGAAQVVAAELGISFENEKFKINELVSGMRKANLIGKVINIFPVRTFTRNNQENKVANFIIADETSNTKVVLWDTHHIELIEKGNVAEGKVIEILNASVRDGNEVHLGSFSELKLSNEVIENVNLERKISEKSISEFRISDNVRFRAFVVQTFDPRFFHVCSECRKKVVSGSEGFICTEHGKVAAEKRALINIVLDDGTETTRAVVFHDNLGELGITALEESEKEKLSFQKEDLLGRELVFSGNVRMNKFFNNPEFIINKVEQVNLDEVLKELGA